MINDIGRKLHLTLRDFADENKAFNSLYLFYRRVQFAFIGANVNVKRALRAKGIGGNRYKKLLDYKDIHKGER